MEAIFGLSTTAQLILGPITAGVMVWICFWVIPESATRIRKVFSRSAPSVSEISSIEAA